MPDWPRIVVHADMDAFYAAVEQLDDPALRGRPVIIGPRSWRGVVLTASYEARCHGVGSAMPMAEARRRCPDALIVPPRMHRYTAISEQVMDVFADFSPAVEPLSLDEAFIDMSGAQRIFGSPTQMGQLIRLAVREATGLAVSVGVSATKYVAKVASDHGKPDGLCVVAPDDAVAWLAPLPVTRLWGVGAKTAARLFALELRTVGDIAATPQAQLHNQLGSLGVHLHRLAHARDPRRVRRGRTAKSIGSDRTLSTDVSRRSDIELHLRRAAERIARRVRRKHYAARGIRVRLKTTHFEMLTRQMHLSRPADTAGEFFDAAQRLLDRFEHPGPFRLVGMAAFDLDWRERPLQTDLFEDGRQRRLEVTMDRVVDRFGSGAVVRAKDMADAGTVHDDGINLDFLDYRDGERVSKPG